MGHQCLKERVLAAVEDDPVCPDGLELEAPRPAAAILRATSMSSFQSTAHAQKKKVAVLILILSKNLHRPPRQSSFWLLVDDSNL